MARKAKIHPFSYDPESEKGRWFENWVAQLKKENRNVSACILDRLYAHRDDDLDERVARLERRLEELTRQGQPLEPPASAIPPKSSVDINPENPTPAGRKRPNVNKFFKTQD